VVPGKPVVLYFQSPAPAKDYGSLVPENRLQRLMQTVEAYQSDEYLPPITMQFCQNIFDSHALDLQLRDDRGLDYTAVIGEPPVSLHRVAYVFLQDSLNEYLAGGGNELPISEIPRGAYNWVPNLQHYPKLICMMPAVSVAARMDLNISIGRTPAIWMVPINLYRPHLSNSATPSTL